MLAELNAFIIVITSTLYISVVRGKVCKWSRLL